MTIHQKLPRLQLAALRDAVNLWGSGAFDDGVPALVSIKVKGSRVRVAARVLEAAIPYGGREGVDTPVLVVHVVGVGSRFLSAAQLSSIECEGRVIQ